MPASDVTAAAALADSVRARLRGREFDVCIGPEGDYLRITAASPPQADISVSLAELPPGEFSVQVCIEGDPLHIVYDDICDLQTLHNVCVKYIRTH